MANGHVGCSEAEYFVYSWSLFLSNYSLCKNVTFAYNGGQKIAFEGDGDSMGFALWHPSFDPTDPGVPFPPSWANAQMLKTHWAIIALEGKQQCLYFPLVQRFARLLFRPLVSSLQTVSVPKRAVHLLIITQTFVTEENSNHEVPHRWDRSFSSHDCFPRWDFLIALKYLACIICEHTVFCCPCLIAFSLSPFYLRNADLRAVM